MRETTGQSSLELGFAVSIATTVLGTAYGAVAGLAGGIVDSCPLAPSTAITDGWFRTGRTGQG